MRFENKSPSFRHSAASSGERPAGIRRLPAKLERIAAGLFPRREARLKPCRPRPEPRLCEICRKAQTDTSGGISIPYGNILLHMTMRYLAPRYTLDELLDISAERNNTPRELICEALGRYGEICFETIKMDYFSNILEIEEKTVQELEAFGEQFDLLKANNSDAEMIAALSVKEIYYTAALRKICKPIVREQP